MDCSHTVHWTVLTDTKQKSVWCKSFHGHVLKWNQWNEHKCLIPFGIKGFKRYMSLLSLVLRSQCNFRFIKHIVVLYIHFIPFCEAALLMLSMFYVCNLLPPQCRRQSIVDQVWIWCCCYSFVVYRNMWIPLGWSFLWRLFIVEFVFPVIVVIWVVPPGVAVSWAPCFEWGKKCFFIIGKNQVSSCLLE